VEEVAEEGRGAGQAACGDAAPAVAGEGGAEKVGEGEAAEDIAEVVLGEGGIPRYRRLWLHRRWRLGSAFAPALPRPRHCGSEVASGICRRSHWVLFVTNTTAC
jgi:hypothetical protein